MIGGASADSIAPLTTPTAPPYITMPASINASINAEAGTYATQNVLQRSAEQAPITSFIRYFLALNINDKSNRYFS